VRHISDALAKINGAPLLGFQVTSIAGDDGDSRRLETLDPLRTLSGQGQLIRKGRSLIVTACNLTAGIAYDEFSLGRLG
jgi:hypothetical protein